MGSRECPYCGETFAGPNMVNHMPCDDAPDTSDRVDHSTDYGGVDKETREMMGI